VFGGSLLEQLQRVAAELLDEMSSALGATSTADLPPIAYMHAQRWQAGITRSPLRLNPPCASWEAHGLVACGDWAAEGASVEQAARSGLAAAAAMSRVREVPDLRGPNLTIPGPFHELTMPGP
jgi:predicted NAD/FAD-dependent oxidoreductase